MLPLTLDVKSKPYHIRNTINSLEKSLDNPEKGLVHLMLKNKTCRKVHQERLKAIVRVAQVLVFFTDFRTGNIGKLNPQTGEFTHMSVKAISYHAGIELTRTKRALSDLAVTMYFESKRRVERVSEFIFKSYNSIKKLSDKFFYHLGMQVKTLKKIRRYKEQEHAERKNKNKFYITEAEFIRKRVYEKTPQRNRKNFTETVPINILDIILKRFSI